MNTQTIGPGWNEMLLNVSWRSESPCTDSKRAVKILTLNRYAQILSYNSFLFIKAVISLLLLLTVNCYFNIVEI